MFGSRPSSFVVVIPTLSCYHFDQPLSTYQTCWNLDEITKEAIRPSDRLTCFKNGQNWKDKVYQV